MDFLETDFVYQLSISFFRSYYRNIMSSLQSNPWASGASYVSVGGLQKALKIAQSPGYGGLLLDTERSTERAATSSIEQIQHLKEIAKLDEKVNEVLEYSRLIKGSSFLYLMC